MNIPTEAELDCLLAHPTRRHNERAKVSCIRHRWLRDDGTLTPSGQRFVDDASDPRYDDSLIHQSFHVCTCGHTYGQHEQNVRFAMVCSVGLKQDAHEVCECVQYTKQA